MNDTNQQPQRPYYDDEISLVDLATTFIRRRRVFYVVFVSVLLLAAAYTLLFKGEMKEYRTLIQLSEEWTEEGSEPIESATTVLATIETGWYPALQVAYVENAGEQLPFKISATNPKETSLIKLSSEAPPEMAGEVEKAQQQLVDRIMERQNSLVERSKRALQHRLESINNMLDRLSERQVAGEAIAQAIQQRGSIEAQLESLQPAKILVVARESLDNKGTSKKLILALAIVLGLMLGIFAAFMAEFASQVRQAIKEKD